MKDILKKWADLVLENYKKYDVYKKYFSGENQDWSVLKIKSGRVVIGYDLIRSAIDLAEHHPYLESEALTIKSIIETVNREATQNAFRTLSIHCKEGEKKLSEVVDIVEGFKGDKMIVCSPEVVAQLHENPTAVLSDQDSFEMGNFILDHAINIGETKVLVNTYILPDRLFVVPANFMSYELNAEEREISMAFSLTLKVDLLNSFHYKIEGVRSQFEALVNQL